MSIWYYYNEKNEKIQITGGQLKGLAKAGLITPDTMVETENGKSAPARKVKGLTFTETTQSELTPVTTTTNYFYIDTNGAKQGLLNEIQLKELAARKFIGNDTG